MLNRCLQTRGKGRIIDCRSVELVKFHTGKGGFIVSAMTVFGNDHSNGRFQEGGLKFLASILSGSWSMPA